MQYEKEKGEVDLVDNVKYYCQLRGVSVAALAKALNIDESTIWRWKNRRGVDYRTVCRVAHALHVLVDDLVEGVWIEDFSEKDLYR